jgi:tetratricopeptide (TPR) repeat protein
MAMDLYSLNTAPSLSFAPEDEVSDVSPAGQAKFYYDRAKKLYLDGSGKSSELERILRDLYRASSHVPDDTRHYVFVAKVFKRLGDYHSMMSSLLYVLKLDPNHSLAKRLLYDGYMRRGQEYMCCAAEESSIDPQYSQKLWKKALACFDFAIAIKHDESRLWLHHAICCIHLKENTKALASVNHCLRISNNFAQGESKISYIPEDQIDVLTLRAKLYWALGLVDIGNKEIRQVAVHAPDHMEVLAYTARCYHAAENYYKFSIREFANGNYHDALHYANVAAKITEDDIKLYILISKIYRIMNKLDEAFAAIRKAKQAYFHQLQNRTSHYERQLERQDQDNQVKENPLGLLSPTKSMFASEFKETSIEQSISQIPVNENTNQSTDKSMMEVPDEIIRQTNLIFNDLGIKFASEGDYDRAIVLFTKVINSSADFCKKFKLQEERSSQLPVSSSLSSPNTSISADYSRPASPINKFDESDCHKYLMDHKFYVNRGDCYRAIGKIKESYADYKAALKIAPKEWIVRTKMSILHYHQGVEYFNDSKFLLADQELSKAIELNPKISEYYAIRGRVRYYFSDFTGAANDYKKCLELDPSAANVAMRLEQFEAGGSHSMIQIEQKLPAHILKLVDISKQHIKKLKQDAARSKTELRGLFFLEEDEDKQVFPHHKVNKSKNQAKKFSKKVRRISRLPPLPSQNLSLSSNKIELNSQTQSNISTNFLPVLQISEDYKIKKKLAEIELAKKLDVTKGSLWPLLDNARKLAKEKQEVHDDFYEAQHLPSNALALKKMSRAAEKTLSMDLAKGISSKVKPTQPLKKFINFKSSSYKRKLHRSISTQSKSSIVSDVDSLHGENDANDEYGGFINYDSMQSSSIMEDNSFPENFGSEEDIDGNVEEDDDLDEDELQSSIDHASKPKSRNRRRSIRNKTYSKLTDDDEEEADDDLQSSLDDLYKPIGVSKVVDFLRSRGIDHEWKLEDTSIQEDSKESALLVSEDEEIRRGYQKAALELESVFIQKQLDALKKDKMLKDQQVELQVKEENRRNSVYFSED